MDKQREGMKKIKISETDFSLGKKFSITLTPGDETIVGIERGSIVNVVNESGTISMLFYFSHDRYPLTLIAMTGTSTFAVNEEVEDRVCFLANEDNTVKVINNKSQSYDFSFKTY